MRADSARAFSASRNSSTNRMQPPPLLDGGVGQRGQLLVVGLADALQELEGGGRLLLVDLGEGEADVNQDPIAYHGPVVAFQQADVDGPPDAAHSHPATVDPIA